MSMSGIMDRTRIKGMLKFTLSSFPDVLPKRYARAMCPTANEVFVLLENGTSHWLIIKSIGSWYTLGVHQSQLSSWRRLVAESYRRQAASAPIATSPVF
jgi:hypothetical protein